MASVLCSADKKGVRARLGRKGPGRVTELVRPDQNAVTPTEETVKYLKNASAWRSSLPRSPSSPMDQPVTPSIQVSIHQTISRRSLTGHSQMQGHTALVGIDDIELHLGQDPLHGFEIEPGAGDVGDPFIFLLKGQELAGLTESFGDPLLLVGIRLGQPRASFASRPGKEVAPKRPGFVDQ